MQEEKTEQIPPIQPTRDTEQTLHIEPEPTKRRRMSGRTKTIIAIIIIALAVALVPFAPPEGEQNNTTGDLPVTPTVGVTNLLQTVNVNKQVMLNGVQVTVIKVMEANKFSDDRKRIGTYTVRVLAYARNDTHTLIGVKYVSLVHLELPNGTIEGTKYISINPVALPKSAQSGFFDFPLSSVVPLSSLTLHFGTERIALGSS